MHRTAGNVGFYLSLVWPCASIVFITLTCAGIIADQEFSDLAEEFSGIVVCEKASIWPRVLLFVIGTTGPVSFVLLLAFGKAIDRTRLTLGMTFSFVTTWFLLGQATMWMQRGL